MGLIGVKAVVEEIRILQSKVNQMAAQCDNPDATAAVQKFAEERRYTDPVSSDALIGLEADLSAAVDELQSAAHAEGNRICKLSKSG